MSTPSLDFLAQAHTMVEIVLSLLYLVMVCVMSILFLFVATPAQHRATRRKGFLDLPPGMVERISYADWDLHVGAELRWDIYEYARLHSPPSPITLSHGCECWFLMKNSRYAEHCESCVRKSRMSDAPLVLLAQCCKQTYAECKPLYMRFTRVHLDNVSEYLSMFFRTNMEFENRKLIVALTVTGLSYRVDVLRLLQSNHLCLSFGLQFEAYEWVYEFFADSLKAIAEHRNPIWLNDLRNNIKKIHITCMHSYANNSAPWIPSLSMVHPYLEVVFKRDRAPAWLQQQLDDLTPSDSRTWVGVDGRDYKTRAGLDGLLPAVRARAPQGSQDLNPAVPGYGYLVGYRSGLG
ncbi:hypothetical protein BDV96DRAFT_642790 [Lophiotrema nucula]|uniref:Uncharacterized protein n=1 Tax=Lophiotrema nucula TaxID=690887 RepID=A0A6A5ZLQ1_9PLEO|nr:hypothetical protein BDV96DRAFT_642790 [Lophiotrema nucula]